MSRNESCKDVDFLVEDLWLEYKVEFLFFSWNLSHIRCSGALLPPYTCRIQVSNYQTKNSEARQTIRYHFDSEKELLITIRFWKEAFHTLQLVFIGSQHAQFNFHLPFE